MIKNSARKRWSRQFRGAVFDFLARMTSSKIALRKLRQKNYPQFAAHYGNFRFDEDWRPYAVAGLSNESGLIFGQVVKALADVPRPINRVLLPGENAAAKKVYIELLDIDADRIVTAGLHDDAEVNWNFEETRPDLGTFDCIVSHAILEHLIDPYKHISDLAAFLQSGGRLIVHTVVPGFPYHRYPVDCFRFFPDWFEEVAKRLNLTVIDKYIGEEQIVYTFGAP